MLHIIIICLVKYFFKNQFILKMHFETLKKRMHFYEHHKTARERLNNSIHQLHLFWTVFPFNLQVKGVEKVSKELATA